MVYTSMDSMDVSDFFWGLPSDPDFINTLFEDVSNEQEKALKHLREMQASINRTRLDRILSRDYDSWACTHISSEGDSNNQWETASKE